MRILFVTHDGTSHEPLGLEYISASLLRAGHETKACMQSRTMETIRRWGPDFLAFQVITGDQDRWGSVAVEAKRRFPKIKTIFGGPHFLFFTKSQQAGADYVIRGDGENSIMDCVEGRQWVDFKPIENMDTRPNPDRSLLYNDDFPAVKNNVIRNFITNFSCPYKCEYCFNSNENWQKMIRGQDRLRYHSPEWVVDDIQRTFSEYGGELVSFQDDIFGIDLKWLERLVKLYKKVNIPFFAQLRPYLITEDRVKLLKEMGIHIASFAIESGNEKTRREVLDRDEPNKLIERGAELLHRYGIKFRVQNLLGLPVEDPLEDALETVRFNIKLKPTLSWSSCLQAYQGTKMAERVIRMGLVKDINELDNLVNATFFDDCSLPIKDKKKVERLQKYWSAIVRWPWLYWIVSKILIHIDFGKKIHEWIFVTSKNYINGKEYWRVSGNLAKHVSIQNRQNLDRLGNEPERIRKVVEEVCA